MPKDNGYAKRDKEIERLRTAMVLAMADLEQLATHPQLAPKWCATTLRVAYGLRKDLEKK